MRLLWALLLGVNSWALAPAKVTSSRCTDLQLITDRKSNRSYIVARSHSGGDIIWEQDGKLFAMSFTDLESDPATYFSVLAFDIIEQQRTAGRISQIEGVGRSMVVTRGRIRTLDRKYSTQRTYVRPDSSRGFVETSILNGDPVAERTVITSEEGAQPRLVMRRGGGRQLLSAGFIGADHTESCVDKLLAWPAARRDFSSLVLNAAQVIESALAQVDKSRTQVAVCQTSGKDCSPELQSLEHARTKRDQTFLTAIDGTRFLAARRSLVATALGTSHRTIHVESVAGGTPPSFAGPHGMGCRSLGTGLVCDEEADSAGNVCSKIGDGYACAEARGTSLCTAWATGYGCSY